MGISLVLNGLTLLWLQTNKSKFYDRFFSNVFLGCFVRTRRCWGCVVLCHQWRVRANLEKASDDNQSVLALVGCWRHGHGTRIYTWDRNLGNTLSGEWPMAQVRYSIAVWQLSYCMGRIAYLEYDLARVALAAHIEFDYDVTMFQLCDVINVKNA